MSLRLVMLLVSTVLVVGCGDVIPTEAASELVSPVAYVATVGGTSCDTNHAWGEVGPHNEFVAPIWYGPGDSVLACGGAGVPGALAVELGWGAGDAMSHNIFQITARVRSHDGSSAIVPIFAGLIEFDSTTSPDTVAVVGLRDFDASVDAVGIVMHYGDSTVAVDDEYFFGGDVPEGVDRNNWAQIWFSIPAPDEFDVTGTGQGTVLLEWEHPRTLGPHYRTEIWRDGSLDTTVSSTVTAVMRAGLEHTTTYQYKLRYVADPVLDWWDTLLDAPASAFTDVETVGTDSLSGTPKAAFSYTCSNLTCWFTDQSSDTNGYGIASHAWRFGDGAISDEDNPTHNYETVGPSYAVWLRVTNGNGVVDSTMAVVEPVVGQIDTTGMGIDSATNNQYPEPWQTCTYSATHSGPGAGYAYEWRVNLTPVGTGTSYPYAVDEATRIVRVSVSRPNRPEVGRAAVKVIPTAFGGIICP